MKLDNLTERDYVEARQAMFSAGLNPKLMFDPDEMEVLGSADDLDRFEQFATPIIKQRVESTAKMSGFQYEGKTYSATAADQHGLADMMVLFNSQIATSVNFEFENGEVMVLTSENILAFGEAFFNFRNTFFGG